MGPVFAGDESDEGTTVYEIASRKSANNHAYKTPSEEAFVKAHLKHQYQTLKAQCDEWKGLAGEVLCLRERRDQLGIFNQPVLVTKASISCTVDLSVLNWAEQTYYAFKYPHRGQCVEVIQLKDLN
jgi:hypothetical protein